MNYAIALVLVAGLALTGPAAHARDEFITYQANHQYLTSKSPSRFVYQYEVDLVGYENCIAHLDAPFATGQPEQFAFQIVDKETLTGCAYVSPRASIKLWANDSLNPDYGRYVTILWSTGYSGPRVHIEESNLAAVELSCTVTNEFGETVKDIYDRRGYALTVDSPKNSGLPKLNKVTAPVYESIGCKRDSVVLTIYDVDATPASP